MPAAGIPDFEKLFAGHVAKQAKRKAGHFDSFAGLRRKLTRDLPLSVAHEVAKRASPAMTAQARTAYGAGRTVYGDARPAGVNGQPLTLRKTGAVEGGLKFVTTGTITRARLHTDYARYLIGKYRILPMGAIPAAWSRQLQQITSEVMA